MSADLLYTDRASHPSQPHYNKHLFHDANMEEGTMGSGGDWNWIHQKRNDWAIIFKEMIKSEQNMNIWIVEQ